MVDCRVDVDWKIANRPGLLPKVLCEDGEAPRAETDPAHVTFSVINCFFAIYNKALNQNPRLAKTKRVFLFHTGFIRLCD